MYPSQTVEEFFARDTKIPIKFNQDVQGLGSLIGTDKNKEILKDQIVEFPFYIAKELVEREISTLQIPKLFANDVMNALKVTPINMNLRNYCPQWQEVINREHQLYGDERQYQLDLTKIHEFSDILKRSKIDRAVEILNRAKRFFEDHNDFLEKLDDEERKMFEEQRQVCEETYVDYTKICTL
ncbi:14495_t:CDS:2 [Funneliformis geosporum]|uniref:DNA replication complex GINS protein PSF3 n=1 Tax=Funneliformis geosporum TaxID=1117311 RepID=A0A9W4SBD8_9GLOM|nr:14495_t:CDS:2 [Funneliformis geosporum]